MTPLIAGAQPEDQEEAENDANAKACCQPRRKIPEPKHDIRHQIEHYACANQNDRRGDCRRSVFRLLIGHAVDPLSSIGMDAGPLTRSRLKSQARSANASE